MKVKELAQDIEICTFNDNLKKTAGIMKQYDSDAVPIVNEENKIVGVITPDGICEAAAKFDRKTSSIRNNEIPLEEILICDPQEKFDKLLKKLSKKRIKYAAFYIKKEKTITLISLPNILLRFTEDKKLIKKVFRAMEKICKPLPLVLSEIGIAHENK